MPFSYSAGHRTEIGLESITWLPFSGIRKSIASLGGYELECAWNVGYHTMRTLVGCRNPVEWPTVRLWRGHETALANYLWHCLEEMSHRNFPEQIEHEFFTAIIIDGPRVQSSRVLIHVEAIDYTTKQLQSKDMLPRWFGWKPLHQSHRIALKSGDASRVTWPWERKINGSVRSRVLQGRQSG